MALSPYTNDNRGGCARIIGCFTEATEKHRFEYFQRNTIDRSGFAPHYPHRVFVGPAGDDTRVAHVKGTVAYVVVDEDINGQPVFEKWQISRHTTYAA